ncbi:polypeptide-transport-associated domain-containing protein [Tepidicaulis marinus]|uniref:Cell division protein FtsQ n=1 Tax=Tepidicaulis marinus TaxID=1333998 RepID=A0A081BA05_9HYPH|nr:cell division protein FtsQ/DivIB [Tepidicaulis marinus]GAK44873.1 polypeptide-transport-associated domain-containing protein [Tepidicaulis marinus]
MPPVTRSPRKRQAQASPRTRKGGTAGRRKVSAAAPGKPRKKAREFGRRKQRPPSRFARFFSALRSGDVSALPLAALAGMLVVFAVFYGLMVGGHFAAAGSSLVAGTHRMIAGAGFSVQDVTVEGRERTPVREVMRALDVERGMSIFLVDVEAARERLERLDWVASASVTRFWPDRIHVELNERVPYAVWQRGGRLAIVDRQGQPITENHIEEYAHLPLVVGHGAADEAPVIQELLAQWPALHSRVRAAVRVGDRRWNLRLENGVDVLLPERHVERALAELVAIENSHRVLARDIEAIDLRLADRFTIRLTPDAAARRAASGVNDLERERSKKGSAT